MKDTEIITNKIQSQLRKGILDFIVLASLTEGTRYPREIIDSLSKEGLDIVEGTLYPLFLRLLKQGLVKHTWKEAGGHPRKYYSLTKQGKQVLKVYKKEWNAMEKIINTLTK